MYHPDQGAILVDGKELSSICAKSWLNKIGYVGQDPFIFHASVTENITMGSKVDMDRVISVCKMANAHEFVDTLESGYDTLIGDRGVKLSGGQRQRLSIARALYSDPDLVVLDEATSALDNTSEKKVQDALGQISKACTTLTIAHRLSTIQDSDQILVLEKGQVVERGNHDELLDLKGVYYHLHQAQSARDFTK
jgi:ABC-type multidrug transport system fused ATPase/permease subunit